MDPTTVIGIGIGVGCVYLGHVLSGELGAQPAAALIVLGGTLGAVIAQFSTADLARAFRLFPLAFGARASIATPELVTRIIELARRSRKEGLLCLEDEASKEQDPFLKQALLALVDGSDTPQLRAQLQNVIDQSEQFKGAGPRFFEAAGGWI